MVRMTLVFGMTLLYAGLGFTSADSTAELKELSSRLIRLLTEEALERRSMYNVVRVQDRTTVYFQTNSQCQGCAHSITYWNGSGEKILRHLKGEKAVLPSTDFGKDLMIRVCEENGGIAKGKNCLYAFLEANQSKTMFGTTHENGI